MINEERMAVKSGLVQWWLGDHVTNEGLLLIQILWRNPFVLIEFLVIWFLHI